ncbi:hypothetical protein ACSBR2_035144 [Camellia fascicularis]
MEKVLEVSLSQIVKDVEFPSHPPPSDYPFLSKAFFCRHGRDLFSCAASWKKLNAYQDAYNVVRFQALLALCSTIPGYWATVFFIDRIGRVKIQIMGFFFMALALLAMGIPYIAYWYNHTNGGFLFLYGLTFFFPNFGPNTTTFVVPCRAFSRFRSTCHGISRASGRVAAIAGSFRSFWASKDNLDNKHSNYVGRMGAGLVVLGEVCIVGMITTCLFTRETMGRSLEENENGDKTQELCFLRCSTNSCMQHRSNFVDEVFFF